MPEVLEPIEARRARRALSDERIDHESAGMLLRAAHIAPSCANNQPWRLIAVDDPEVLAQVKGALSRGNYWAKPAPLHPVSTWIAGSPTAGSTSSSTAGQLL